MDKYDRFGHDQRSDETDTEYTFRKSDEYVKSIGAKAYDDSAPDARVDPEGSAKWFEAREVDTLRKENENLRRIIRDNWCGQYWRAVNHDHAAEINASLNPCAEQIIPVRGRDIKETTR